MSSADHAPSQPATNTTEQLLRVLIGVVGRVAVPEDRLRAVVRSSPKSADKYAAAYNLCDGTRGVSEIARIVGLDQGNLSRVIIRWVDAGIAFRIGDDGRPVHLYRLGTAITGAEAESSSGGGDGAAGATGAPAARSRSVAGARGRGRAGAAAPAPHAGRAAAASGALNDEPLVLPLGGTHSTAATL